MALPVIDTDPDDDLTDVPRFLARVNVAHRVGLKSARSLSGMRLPRPDVIVGDHPGWLPETIDDWQSTRRGRGNFGQRGEVL